VTDTERRDMLEVENIITEAGGNSGTFLTNYVRKSVIE